MNNIIIKLYVPSVEQEYDVKISTSLTVGEVILLLSKSMSQLSDGRFHRTDCEMLCLKDRNLLLDYSHPLQDYNIQNGDRLVLI